MKRLKSFTIAFLLGAGSLAATPQEEARVLYEAGVEHYLKGRWPQAVDHLERSMKIAPSKKTQDFLFTVLKDAGLTLSLKKNYHEAFRYLEKALRIYPADAEIQSLYQAAAEMTGKSLKELNLSEQKEPQSSHAVSVIPAKTRSPSPGPSLKPEPPPPGPLLTVPPLPARERVPAAPGSSSRDLIAVAVAFLLGGALVFAGIRAAWRHSQSRVKIAEDFSARAYEKMEKGERNLLEKMLSSEEKEGRAQMVIRLQEEEQKLLAEMRERLKFEENDLRKKLKEGIEEERALIKKVLDEALSRAKEASSAKSSAPASEKAQKKSIENWALLLDQKQGDDISVRMGPARRRGSETARLLYRYDPRQAISLFQSLAQDQDREKRLNVIYVLADVGGGETVEILAALTRDADLDVQREAIKALKTLSIADPSPRLREILQSIRESRDWIV